GEESSAAVSFDPAQVKTMGDVFAAADEDNYQDLYTDTTYIYVFYVGDVCYRASADMPADVSEAVWDIEFDDEDKDQKVRDLISPLEVASLDNLTEQIPAQEELDKLVGKTGQDLFDDGWDYYYYNLDEMEAGLNHGPFAYIVKFAYDGEPMVNSDDFDFYEAFKDLPITSVTYDGIGDAANMD
ncbi:MAG: hypothetical protein IIY85_04545, partial [Lachnospiraceae bacterium]|nr:hypothetical protein [Lachnospiraceae bacterium]